MIALSVGDTITVKVNGQAASKRTRNRVKENGPTFTVMKIMDVSLFPHLGQNVKSVLVASTTTKWTGWFPAEEIIVSRTSI